MSTGIEWMHWQDVPTEYPVDIDSHIHSWHSVLDDMGVRIHGELYCNYCGLTYRDGKVQKM